MTDPLARLVAALADRYRIEREIGAGGMATVYLAEDLKHHRKVAEQVPSTFTGEPGLLRWDDSGIYPVIYPSTARGGLKFGAPHR